MSEKQRSVCGIVKPLSAFNTDKSRKDGLRYYCAACQSEQARAHRAKTQAYQKARHAAYRKANPDKMRVWVRRYAESEKGRATIAAYRSRPPRVLFYRVQALLRYSLKQGKKDRMKHIVDWTIDELRAHLERQFVKGMSWRNMGEWHIDHIVPLASFSYESANDPEFKRAWALTNLRPMWARQNLSKGAKVTSLL